MNNMQFDEATQTFSGAPFRSRDTNQTVLGFRSTEFADDANDAHHVLGGAGDDVLYGGAGENTLGVCRLRTRCTRRFAIKKTAKCKHCTWVGGRFTLNPSVRSRFLTSTTQTLTRERNHA